MGGKTLSATLELIKKILKNTINTEDLFLMGKNKKKNGKPIGCRSLNMTEKER